MTKSEERFPLLYALNLDDGDNPPTQTRERNLINGASSVLGTWPSAITSTWRMIIGIILCILIFILLVCFMFFLTSVTIPGVFPIPHYIAKRSSTNSCDYVDESSSFDDGGGLWNNLIPLETQTRFIKDEHKVFFVKRESDTLSPESVCAIRSAFKSNNKSTHLIVLVNTDNITTKDEMRIMDELRKDKLDQEMNVMFIDADKYFYDTPLKGVYKDGKSPLKVFAVQVVTLWRFGGLAYDLNLLTLKPNPADTTVTPPSTMITPKNSDTATTTISHRSRATTVAAVMTPDSNATIALDGTIIGSKQPCHAFLFAVMKQLLKVSKRNSKTSVDEVMKLSLQSFCGTDKVDCDCPGVKIIPKEKICSTDQITNKTCVADLKCNWAKIVSNEETKRWADKCPEFVQ